MVNFFITNSTERNELLLRLTTISFVLDQYLSLEWASISVVNKKLSELEETVEAIPPEKYADLAMEWQKKLLLFCGMFRQKYGREYPITKMDQDFFPKVFDEATKSNVLHTLFHQTIADSNGTKPIMMETPVNSTKASSGYVSCPSAKYKSPSNPTTTAGSTAATSTKPTTVQSPSKVHPSSSSTTEKPSPSRMAASKSSTEVQRSKTAAQSWLAATRTTKPLYRLDEELR